MSVEVVAVPDVLIRNLSQSAVDDYEARARELGLSRNEYLRRRLEADLRPDFVQESPRVPVDWNKALDNYQELTDNLSHEELEALSRGKTHLVD